MEHIKPINYVLDTSDENFVAIDDRYKIPALYEAFDYVARELVDKINTKSVVRVTSLGGLTYYKRDLTNNEVCDLILVIIDDVLYKLLGIRNLNEPVQGWEWFEAINTCDEERSENDTKILEQYDKEMDSYNLQIDKTHDSRIITRWLFNHFIPFARYNIYDNDWFWTEEYLNTSEIEYAKQRGKWYMK